MIAGEHALRFAGWTPDCRATLDPGAELAAHCKARGLLPPELPAPHIVTA